MMVRQDGNRLIIERGVSQVWIECWGENSVRIRMCGEPKMDENDWALEEKVPECVPKIMIKELDITDPWLSLIHI